MSDWRKTEDDPREVARALEVRDWLSSKLRAKAAPTPNVGGENYATWNSVLSAFVPVNEPLEGKTNFMYPDSLGFMTTGMGNLIDSDSRKGGGDLHASGSMDTYGPALQLPWLHVDESQASQAEVIAEWQKIKALYPGVQSVAAKAHSSLHISDETIANLVHTKLIENENFLIQGFPTFGDFPAAGQLAIHGMAWAMGGAFWHGFPKFRDAVNGGDWVTGKSEGLTFKAESPQRKAVHGKLFDEAIAVSQNKLDPSHLYYPAPVPVGAVSSLASKMPKGTTIAAVALLAGVTAAGAVYHKEVESYGRKAVRTAKSHLKGARKETLSHLKVAEAQVSGFLKRGT